MRLITVRQLTALSLVAASTPSIMAFSLALEAAKGAGLAGLMARDTPGVFERDDNGGCSSLGLSSDFQSCGMGLPSNFCCDTKNGFTCKAFNNNQSAICCPPGNDCNIVGQIPCNPQGLNVTANPQAAVHSTRIAGGLTVCGDQCCPTGYACSTDSSKTCIMSNSTTSSTSATPTSSGATLSNVPSASGLGPNQMSNSGGTSDSNQCAAYPIPALLVGFFPGLVLGVLATITAIVCIGNRNRRKEARGASQSPMSSPNPSKGIHGPISEPIFHDTGATRMDFLRRKSKARNRGGLKSPGTMSTMTANTGPNNARVRSLFSGSKRTPGNKNVGGSTPRTPIRESSTESIMIFSPDATLGGSSKPPGSATTRDTRWEDVMTGATGLGVKGLAAPPAFLGSPSIVDGRRRPLDGSTDIRR